MNESEGALKAALSLLGRLPGARVHDAPDICWLTTGRPLASLNHVHGIRLLGAEATIEARIDQVHAEVTDRGTLPATWWIGPGTTPTDLASRLSARGLVEAEPEFGMLVDVDGLPSPTGDVEEVTETTLEEWLGVMSRSYGWSDPRGIEAWTELYRGGFEDRVPPWWHVLVRRESVAVACASLFPVGDLAFVTNVGTIPEARGAGHGTTATLAALVIARRLGYGRAALTASLMGRGVYARIGFREDARLDRFLWPGR